MFIENRFSAITFGLLIASTTLAAATVPTNLHDFGLGSQLGGSTLYASLILDSAGNVYGTAEDGGEYGYGVVFRLSKNSSGMWTETVLHSFKGGAQDGETPHAPVVMDSAGNLYGTTIAGGGQCSSGCGIVFELTPTASGPWTETVVHRFSGGTDGVTPFSSVVLDVHGNLYGATTGGGVSGAGVVYKLTPSGNGVWGETVLHSFSGTPDGAAAFAAPVFDSAGHLYGTTNGGGAAGLGTVYELFPQANGSWSGRVLHNFHGTADGSDLFAGLTRDAAGNFYGAAETGGSANCGVAFELMKNSNGSWTFTVLHNFLGINGGDGENPNALIFDAGGNIYGTTVGGGVDNPGTIFRMTPDKSGGWTETVLYSFLAGNDGAYPSAGLVLNAAGTLFGTTLWGGPAGDTTGGVAFEFTP